MSTKAQARMVWAAGALAAALSASVAEAAVLLDVRALSVTGPGAVINNNKTVTLPEGGTVTVGIYLTNFWTVNTNGLSGYSVSVLSKNERYKTLVSPTAFNDPVVHGPTPTATVVNATALDEAPLPAGFSGQSAKVLADCTLAFPVTSDPDRSDTDIDAWKIGKIQERPPVWSVGFGESGDTLLGTATFTALALNPTVYGFNRTVELNSFFTANAIAGGAALFGLTTSSTTDNSIEAYPWNQQNGLITSSSQIGSAVTVTVASLPSTGGAAPLPAAVWPAMGLLAGLGALAGRRRLACR